MEEMLKPKDIQKHLGIGKDKCYELMKLKSFPAIKIGKNYLIPKDAYLKWLEKQQGKSIIL